MPEASSSESREFKVQGMRPFFPRMNASAVLSTDALVMSARLPHRSLRVSRSDVEAVRVRRPEWRENFLRLGEVVEIKTIDATRFRPVLLAASSLDMRQHFDSYGWPLST